MAYPVSVIMPAYNHEKYVGETIESVLGQTFGNFEFVIVNDGSSDRTENVIKKYRDDRIRYHSQGNSDAYNAINNAISLSTGDIIAIINSDDVYHPKRLEMILEGMVRQEAVLAVSDLDLIDSRSRKVDNSGHPLVALREKLAGVLEESGSLKQALVTGNMAITTSNMIFSRQLVDEIGAFRPFRYAHDYDFLLRALIAYPQRLYYHPERLLSYRVHTRNTITENPAKVEIETFKILLMHLPQLMLSPDDQSIASAFTSQVSRMMYVMEDTEVVLAKVFNSRSWKLTAPLRYMAEVMGVSPPK